MRHRDTEKGDGRRVRTILAKKSDLAVEALQEEVEDLKKFVGFQHGAPRNPNGNAYAYSPAEGLSFQSRTDFERNCVSVMN